MTALNIIIGKFDAATVTVPVTFTCPETGRSHTRPVNAVLLPGGKHDRTATRARVAEVAAGVAQKFALGLLGEIKETADV